MSRLVVEELPNLDVNHLNRLGAFEGRKLFPAMALRTSRDLVEYRPDNWPPYRPTQQIPIQWTRCNYGGKRPWFTCLCGKRVGKLYYGANCLGCRHCAEAIYESQRRGRRGRLQLKASRIRARFGDHGRPGIDPFPERPPWFRGFAMQNRTYARIRGRAEAIERELRKGRPYQFRGRRKWFP
jgi:hypothetical protein